jgi:hypothetical protein
MTVEMELLWALRTVLGGIGALNDHAQLSCSTINEEDQRRIFAVLAKAERRSTKR